MSNQTEKGEWPSAAIPSGWSWLDFKSAWTDRTDSKKKVKQREYDDEGALPVVDQGGGLIGGHTNDLSMKNGVDLPCIIFGDHTRAVKFVDFEFAQGADGVKVLKPGPQFDPQFAFQAMRCIELPNKGYSRHFKFLKSSVFPVPPLPEQQRIVAKLDRLSERSSSARDHLTRVTALATRAKQAILSSLLEQESNVVELAELADEIRYGTSKKCSYENGSTPVLRIPNVTAGTVDAHDLKFADFDHKELDKLCLKAGDLLMIRSNGSLDLVGRTAIVEGKHAGFLFAGYLIRIRSDLSKVDPGYLQLVLMSTKARRFIESLAKSTSGVNNINSAQIASIPVPIRSLEQQKDIVERAIAAFARIDRLSEEASRASHLLDRLDERLLAKAFQGELVPQDPDDEPAEAILERIREARATAPKPKRARRKKTA